MHRFAHAGVLLALLLSSTGVTAADYSDTAAVSNAEKKQLIEQTLNQSGFKARIETTPDRMVRAMMGIAKSENITIPPGKAEEMVHENFSVEIMEQSVIQALTNQYDEKRMRAYLALTADPVWSRMNEAALAVPAPGAIKNYIATLAANPPPRERLLLLKRMDEASGASRAAVDLMAGFLTAYKTAVEEVYPGRRELIEKGFSTLNEQLVKNSSSLILTGYVFAYRDISDEDLKHYVQLLESADAEWLTTVVQTAINEAVRSGIKGYGRQMAGLLKDMTSIPNTGKCTANDATPTERVADCTHALEAGGLTKEQQAVVYRNRGEAYDQQGDFDKAVADLDLSIGLNSQDTYTIRDRGNAHADRGEYDLAIVDFDQAIRLDPKNAWAYKDRGAAWGYKHDYDRALADVDEAIRLNPDFGEAYFSRGQLEFYEGRFDQAASDLDAVLPLIGDDDWLKHNLTYVALWAYLSRSHNGVEGKEKLAAQIRDLSLEQWPGPVINFYLRKLDAQAVLAEAARGSADDQVQQKCEANFYIGQDYLLRKNTAQARRFLGTARDICPPVFIEFHGAEAEMKRLQ